VIFLSIKLHFFAFANSYKEGRSQLHTLADTLPNLIDARIVLKALIFPFNHNSWPLLILISTIQYTLDNALIIFVFRVRILNRMKTNSPFSRNILHF
jgi:hypothetical protein